MEKLKGFKIFLKEQKGKTLYFTFGRFDPPTPGHRKLFTVLKQKAQGDDWLIFPSRTTDLKKSFLDIDNKIKFMKELNPDYASHIVDNPAVRTVINVMENYKYDKYVLIVAPEEASAMQSFIKYAPEGTTLEIPTLTELNRDKGDGVSGMSSSKLKALIVDGKEKAFITGIGNDKIGKEIWDLLVPYKDKIAKYVIKKEKS